MDNKNLHNNIDYEHLNENYEFQETDEGIVITGFKELCGRITIPDGVVKIADGAFMDCWDISSVTIPDSVKVIESSAFKNCESLEEVIIPDSVEEIGESAFDYCSSLESITIPNSIKVIKKRTFANTAIKQITIPDSVLLVEDCAFEDCKNLIKVFKKDSTYAPSYAFNNSKYYKNNFSYHESSDYLDDAIADFIYDEEEPPYFSKAIKAYSGRDYDEDFDLEGWLCNLDSETLDEFMNDCNDGF